MAARKKAATGGGEPAEGAVEQTAATSAPAKKRGPGRPKGSKTRAKKSPAKAAAKPVKRGPGRPKGSKNKATKARATKTSASRATGARRGRTKKSENISDRIDAMIQELNALKEEVAKLDQVRSAIRDIY